jgi:predicted nucleic acid-binding protein
MNIVVDTSVIIAVIANEPEKDCLIQLTKGADLIAPYSVNWEVGNVFSAMLKRGRIKLGSVMNAIEVYGQIPIRFVDVELGECLRMADALGSYAYDAYLIRCARKYRSPLISLDNHLVNCAKQVGAEVLEVTR